MTRLTLVHYAFIWENDKIQWISQKLFKPKVRFSHQSKISYIYSKAPGPTEAIFQTKPLLDREAKVIVVCHMNKTAAIPIYDKI